MVDISALALIDDAEALEAAVEALPASEVVGLLHLVTESRRHLYQAERMLKSRIVGEGILSGGEAWTAPDGTEFAWVGDRERVCSDPAAMKAQLEELPLSVLAKRALQQAFREQPLKLYLTHLDEVERYGGEDAGRIIRSFVVWRESPPKLRNISETGR